MERNGLMRGKAELSTYSTSRAMARETIRYDKIAGNDIFDMIREECPLSILCMPS